MMILKDEERPCGGSSGAPPAHPSRRQSIAQAPGLPAWLGTMRSEGEEEGPGGVACLK